MSDITVVNGPLEVYWAAAGTSMPTLSADPTGSGFTKLGTNGENNYTEEGVIVRMNQTVEAWRALGSTFPRKAFRTSEELVIQVTLADLSLAQLRSALNQNTVTSGASDDEISLERGLDVNTVALLVRGTGKSPEFDGGNLQFEIDECYEFGSPEQVFVKGEPAATMLQFAVIDSGTAPVLRAATS